MNPTRPRQLAASGLLPVPRPTLADGSWDVAMRWNEHEAQSIDREDPQSGGQTSGVIRIVRRPKSRARETTLERGFDESCQFPSEFPTGMNLGE